MKCLFQGGLQESYQVHWTIAEVLPGQGKCLAYLGVDGASELELMSRCRDIECC